MADKKVSYSAHVPKRIAVALAWSAAIFALIVGRRILYAIDNPDYSVPWFAYAIGIGIPAALMILPSILTATGIEFTQDTISLCYMGRSKRSFTRSSVFIRTKNRRVITMEGDPQSGWRRGAYLFSSGFTKEDWNAISSQFSISSSHENH